jgi:hypothetical protein
MLHNDVVPEPGWLDILLDEMAAHDADLMSAVIPIKDPICGLTSTGIDSDNPFEVERRITMTELFELPETFTSVDCGYGSDRLLVNTGCFVLDFTKDWRKFTNPDGTLKLCFTSPDRIGRRADGQWECQHAPADWGFSRYLNSLGLKVMATRKVRVMHMGDMGYANDHAWGDWTTDNALAHKFDGVPVYGRPHFRKAEPPAGSGDANGDLAGAVTSNASSS